ncbi:uncharacterized protein BDW47DRAFT_123506 [Aspergillus candidus]|uniref:Invertebrate defensins family profile domain-containing protein n=1 Tax=Aspergillus candidus TaxID=41067 RepID=A0A2I2FIN1_ASPCN|nr:hypothetical protein BDW47DRAFT_123506 [Aspergillus candidus]PLB40486.1 hypothetical protein BDW47DRAFT_123506 [Aspergillus candidus]
MQFSTIFLSAVALFGSISLAAPAPVAEAAPAPAPEAEAEAEPGVILARSSCQAGSIFDAGDAACSASCIAQGQGFHGGYCSKKAVCHCTH